MGAAAGAELAGAIDLSDSDAFVERVPYEWFDELRRADPVHWQRERTGRGFWAVTRHADVVAVSKDWETFSSEVGASSLEELDPDALAARQSMIDTDPPLHTELRRVVSSPFTARSVGGYEALVRSITRTVLDDVRTEERFDFVERVASAVPIKVLCRLLGVPERDEGLMIRLGDQMIANTDPELAAVLFDSAETDTYRLLPFRSPAALEMFEYSRRLAAARRRSPRRDLVSALVEGSVAGRRLGQREIDAMFLLLVVAGNETTRNAISHGVLALSRFPDQREKWWSDFDTLAPSAVEEIVRWASPVVYMRRTLTQDVELSGTKMAAGDKVTLWYNSANRDESKFANPWAFDVSRNPNPHVGFGGGGAHFCLGANLARREIRVAFEELHREIPDIVAKEEPARLLSQFIHGIKTLPVAWTPRA